MPRLNNRGNAYAHIKEYKEAVTNFSRAIEIDPGMAAAYFNRATARAAMGETNEAEYDFEKFRSLILV